MGCRFKWGWDDQDGKIIKRFSRVLACEAWLVGIERADPLDDRYENVGASIVDTVTGAYRKASCVVIPFAIDYRRVDAGMLIHRVVQPGEEEPQTMQLPLAQVLGLALPGDGSFPRKDSLEFLRSLAPDDGDTFTMIEQRPVTDTSYDNAAAFNPRNGDKI